MVILCFGDSITYGYDPATGGRFAPKDRWPEVMAQQLGAGHHVITEALPGRTTVFDSPYAPARSGRDLLAPLLESHAPLDLVIIMLGTNDLQVPLELSARHAASGLWTLLDIVARSNAGPAAGPPQCLVVVPPAIRPEARSWWPATSWRGRMSTVCTSMRKPSEPSAVLSQIGWPRYSADLSAAVPRPDSGPSAWPRTSPGPRAR